MNEEIDIIELLKRVKEGKAPKEIEVNDRAYYYNDTWELKYAYAKRVENRMVFLAENESITLHTKIKILDKPKIDKIPETIKLCDDGSLATILYEKINEIIDFINKKGDNNEN